MKSIYIVGVLLSSLLFSCTMSPSLSQQAVSPIKQTFVGQITGEDSLTAFQIEGQQVKAYTCGGEKSWQAQTAWFSGEIDSNHHLTLKSNDNRIITGGFSDTLTAPPKGITAPPQGITAPPQGILFQVLVETMKLRTGQGEMILADGKKLNWVAEETKTTSSGLYRYENDEMVIGVIVHNDGRVVGASLSKQSKQIIGPTKLLQPVLDKRCLNIEANGQSFEIEPLGETGNCK